MILFILGEILPNAFLWIYRYKVKTVHHGSGSVAGLIALIAIVVILVLIKILSGSHSRRKMGY